MAISEESATPQPHVWGKDQWLALDIARTCALPLHANPARNSGGTHLGEPTIQRAKRLTRTIFLRKSWLFP